MTGQEQREDLKRLCQEADIPDKSGELRTRPGAQMTEDSLGKRFVWNLYHPVSKHLYVGDMTEHTYSSSTPRPWNGDSALHFGFVLGQPQEVDSSTHAGVYTQRRKLCKRNSTR